MFNVYLKFNESLGEEGLARDYSVLGEENFEEIIRRYKENFEGQYATRASLGGIGDVDYLVVPHAFFNINNTDNPVSMFFSEMGQLYYYPINLACYWFSSFPLDSFRIEGRVKKYLLKDVIETYYESLEEIQQTVKNHTPGEGGLYYISKPTIEKYVPVLYDFKKEMVNSFEDIVRNRYDLVFQNDGLEKQLEGFLKMRGIDILQKNDLESSLPILFKNIIKFSTTKLEKNVLSVLNQMDSKFYNLLSKKNEVFFTSRMYPWKLFMTPSIFYFSSIDIHKHKDLSAFLNTDTNQGKSIMESLIEFVYRNFSKVISLKILYDPVFNIQKSKFDIEVQCDIIYVGDDGFVKIVNLNLNQIPKNIDLPSFYEYLISKKRNREFINKPIVQVVDISRIDSNENIELDMEFVQESIHANTSGKYNLPVVFLEKYYYLTRVSYGAMPRYEFQYNHNEYTRGWIDYFFMNRKEYDVLKSCKLLQNFLYNYKVQLNDNELITIFFSTVDLSITINEIVYDEKPKESLLKITRVGDYIDYSTTIEDLKEKDVLQLYNEIINYAFLFQKKLVEKYGSIEYLLTIIIRYGIVEYQRVSLLTEENDKMLIHEEWF